MCVSVTAQVFSRASRGVNGGGDFAWEAVVKLHSDLRTASFTLLTLASIASAVACGDLPTNGTGAPQGEIAGGGGASGSSASAADGGSASVNAPADDAGAITADGAVTPPTSPPPSDAGAASDGALPPPPPPPPCVESGCGGKGRGH